ncbi:hypothetical protein [Paenibacillus sp. 32352]|nr:hypothetical protein [Paenibacillus sp. 32352]
MAVDTTSELPMALSITPSYVNDGDIGPVFIEQVAGMKVKLLCLMLVMTN